MTQTTTPAPWPKLPNLAEGSTNGSRALISMADYDLARACVNACAGINDVWLAACIEEGGLLPKLLDRDRLQKIASDLAEEINQQAFKMASVETQRDKLATFLQIAASELADQNWPPFAGQRTKDLLDRIDAELDKCPAIHKGTLASEAAKPDAPKLRPYQQASLDALSRRAEMYVEADQVTAFNRTVFEMQPKFWDDLGKDLSIKELIEQGYLLPPVILTERASAPEERALTIQEWLDRMGKSPSFNSQQIGRAVRKTQPVDIEDTTKSLAELAKKVRVTLQVSKEIMDMADNSAQLHKLTALLKESRQHVAASQDPVRGGLIEEIDAVLAKVETI